MESVKKKEGLKMLPSPEKQIEKIFSMIEREATDNYLTYLIKIKSGRDEPDFDVGQISWVTVCILRKLYEKLTGRDIYPKIEKAAWDRYNKM